MRLRNLLAALSVAVFPLWATTVHAGSEYIYVANDSSTDSITISSTSGGGASKLIQLPTNGTVDPHELAISGNFLFIANDSSAGTVSEYMTSGAPTANSISIGSGNSFTAVAVSGNDLFVANYDTGIIGEYSFDVNTGAFSTVNADLITLPSAATSGPDSLLVSGGNLYVAATAAGDVYGYTTAGASLGGFTTITGIGYNNPNGGLGPLNDPIGLAVSNGDLFVADSNTAGTNANSIGEFDAGTGATINAKLITGLSAPTYLALNINGDLLVSNHNSTTVGEYQPNGTVVKSNFITGLNAPFGIAVGFDPVPLPPVWATFAGCVGMVIAFRQFRGRKVIA